MGHQERWERCIQQFFSPISFDRIRPPNNREDYQQECLVRDTFNITRLFSCSHTPKQLLFSIPSKYQDLSNSAKRSSLVLKYTLRWWFHILKDFCNKIRTLRIETGKRYTRSCPMVCNFRFKIFQFFKFSNLMLHIGIEIGYSNIAWFQMNVRRISSNKIFMCR